MTAATALLSAAAAVSAHTGVSGQLGVPTSGVMTPLQNASSSPVVVAPPPPAEQPAPRTPSTQPVVSVPSPSPSSSPSFPARPPVAVTPSAPAPVPFSSENAEPRKREKKRGAQFYAPYLTTTDSLDRAITDQTARVAAHPDDPALRNDLGNLLARRGFAKEAFDQYDKAARLDREFFLADYNAGLLWEKEGRTAPAISAYRRSIKRKPGFPLSRFHLGFLYEKQGRNSIAAREYAKALRVDPSLRWPSRNPLVVQTRLLYRASLENYDRDLASATLSSDGEFADRAVWERLQPQQPVDTSELDSETDETEPQVIGPTKPPTAPLIGGTPSAKTPDARRQQLIDQFRKSRQPVRPNSIPSRTTIPPPPMIPPPAQAQPPPPDENAPVEEEPPPPRTFS
jgi:hypothetical protein